MLTAAAFVPSPPLLVPELCGLAAAETADLRDAVLDVGRALSDAAEWVVVGVEDTERTVPATARGTFRGFGADVTVALGPDADGDPDPLLPLPALVAGWLRDRTAPQVRVDTHVLAAATDADKCADLGAELRARLDADDLPRALLVVADGAATLTPKAPGAHDPRSEAVEAALAAALAAGDPAALAHLDPALCAEIRLEGRAAWHVLAGAFPSRPTSVTVGYSAAPYGVGYHAGVWKP
ncbi:hypothetical protein OED52_08890 [Rhodococcus sp. Z13]|uniref:Uncharacterized protein n=1 Tax=Rhodococcus sacchari TaxID=2962047 RepID=A0ACD4DLS3_9NOCA|nr:hypothetical protein [Rhodococcus sp. Z13]UYP20981.1 hypothetical protein OED52_08890 [Rhodococcus sp. Z13]